MIRRTTVHRRRILLLGLVAAMVSACTTGSAPRMVGTGNVVYDRQRLMKIQGAQWNEIQAKFKAGDIKGIAPNAEVEAVTSMQIPSLFPEGSLPSRSKAKPEIWERWGEFEATAKNMTIWSERLRDAAQANDEKAVADIMKDYGRVTCGACHTTFRQPQTQR
jgi:cytochrome c556